MKKSAFLAPFLPPTLRRRPPHTVRLCIAPQPPPADDFALVDDASSSLYLQTLLHGGSTAQPKPKNKSKAKNVEPPPVIEDEEVTTLIDDETPPDIFVNRSVELASARSARRPKSGGKPVNVSRNVSKRARRSATAAQDIPDLIGDSGTMPRAPNGIPGGQPDLLSELLPLLAKDEQEERRNRNEKEEDVRNRVNACCDQLSSMHRSTARLDNLRPFRLREEARDECDACSGTGMTACEYCNGEGFVDLGENAEKFDGNFKGNELSMPKHVTGNIYHCPLCGGLQEERCVKCFGLGVDPQRNQRQEGEAEEDMNERAWQEFDFEELLKQEGDRIEVGLDGTIILRAKKPKRTGRKPRKGVASNEKTAVAKLDEEGSKLKKQASAKRKRGRPPKSPKRNVNLDYNPETGDEESSAETPPSSQTQPRLLVPRGRTVGKSTDFVNTTDYKVGRQLRTEPSAAQRRQKLFSDDALDARAKRATGSEEDGT